MLGSAVPPPVRVAPPRGATFAFVLAPTEARLLTEIGFLAAARGDLPRARKIFGALRILRPERAFPLIGLALACMNAGQFEEASRLLQDARLPEPEALQLRVWHGLALWLGGARHAGWQAMKSAVAALESADADPQALALARALAATAVPGAD